MFSFVIQPAAVPQPSHQGRGCDAVAPREGRVAGLTCSGGSC